MIKAIKGLYRNSVGLWVFLLENFSRKALEKEDLLWKLLQVSRFLDRQYCHKRFPCASYWTLGDNEIQLFAIWNMQCDLKAFD